VSNIITQEFQGKNIRFETRDDGSIWGCLTDMAKSTNTLIGNYLRNENTLALTRALEKTKGKVLDVQKGKYGGTWGTEEMVIDFGYWSNIELRLWVIDVIKKLGKDKVVMLEGVSSQAVVTEYQNVGGELEELRQTVVELQKALAAKDNQIKTIEPWAYPMPLHKMRFLEIINYRGDEYSPFLSQNGFKSVENMTQEEYEEHQLEQKRQGLFLKLIDTLFTGEQIDLFSYGFTQVTQEQLEDEDYEEDIQTAIANWEKSYQQFQKTLPEKLYRVLTNPYQDYSKKQHPAPSENFIDFQFSIEMKQECGKVWLEYVPEKKEQLESYLFAKETLAA
jgi:hypothetical protein